MNGTRLFFSAISPGAGRELWVSDGTAAGTRQVTEIDPGPSDGMREDAAIIAFGNGVLFTGQTYSIGRELWFSDGTAAGTAILYSSSSEYYPLLV